MYATEKHNQIMIRPDDQSFSGIKVPFLSTYVDKADFSSLAPEKAGSEEERLWDELQPLMKKLEEAAENALEIIAELQALRAYREYRGICDALGGFSTHNEFIIVRLDEDAEEKRIANSIYSFHSWISNRSWKKTSKPYVTSWYLSIWSPKSSFTGILAKGSDKGFPTLDAARKYLDGRFEVYKDLFTTELPPIPREYEGWYKVAGNLPEGVTVTDEEIKGIGLGL